MKFSSSHAELRYSIVRILGWGWLILGSLIVIVFASATLDPEGVITINRVPTKDLERKLVATCIAALFPVAGAFLALSPRRRIERFLSRGEASKQSPSQRV